ncbi:hypothetical protein ACH5RR_024373 [Cinchona calisaya]|uniref:RING-type E3 ubiquitin transferase n=1 Tax=Cinchona calisaya TaxID=153742 RepID=A0ABD2YWG6_9GENT
MAKWSHSQECIINAAVAIDRDKNSQFAVKWAIDNLNLNGFVTLLHVKTLLPQVISKEGRAPTQDELKQLFLPCRGFWAPKGVTGKEVVLQDTDVASAVAEYIADNSDNPSSERKATQAKKKKGIQIRTVYIEASLIKSVPDFCTVYVVSKAKTQAVKLAIRSPNPSSITSSRQQLQLGYSADTLDLDQLNCQGSWRSSISDRLSTDGGSPAIFSGKSSEFMTMTSSSGQSRNHSPQYSARNGGELAQGMLWDKASNHTNSSPQHPLSSGSSDLVHAAPWDRQLNSKNTPPHKSVPKATNFMQITPYNRNPGSKIPSPPFLGYNSNLHLQSQGSSSHSLSDSSDRSDPLSFQSSNMPFELLDQSRTSDASRTSFSSQCTPELEEEMRRLKQELKQTMEMYNSACKEAPTAKEKAKDIDEWKSDEARRIEECKKSQEVGLIMVEMERHKCKVAIEAAQMAQCLAELESQKRKHAEMKFLHEAGEKKKAMDALARCDASYRKYDIEEIEIATNYFSHSEEIGEGGYGPVYKAYLDHTAVAIKVFRSDISQGKKQFKREVEVLRHMRHPNMVLLLGACPKYGCLVYEYMENGSLEDRLFCKNGSSPLPWTVRFRIAAEIATALLFLRQTRPEPLVHRDLKPANILLDRNYMSKIGDVGLSRLVPPSAADSVTQNHMTAAAGTFCYIDPEYQQTGMLGTKSDIYSLGVMLLQIITAKPAMGLTYHVEEAIEHGTFSETLDPKVFYWPVEEALSFAKLALQCCELRRRDRPDLGSVILPELERLRDLGSDAEARGGNGKLNEAILQNQISQESISLSQDASSIYSDTKMEDQHRYTSEVAAAQL